jgi:hypothetical protein
VGAPARSGREACTTGLEDAGSILKRTHPEFVISKYRMRQADGISLVRKNREAGTQRLAFSSRPFVLLCSSPSRHRAFVQEMRTTRATMPALAHGQTTLRRASSSLIAHGLFVMRTLPKKFGPRGW